jgi:hypothetical protein
LSIDFVQILLPKDCIGPLTLLRGICIILSMTTAELLSRRIAANKQHAALSRKRKALLAKANRMHPALARPLYAQAEELDAEIEKALKS